MFPQLAALPAVPSPLSIHRQVDSVLADRKQLATRALPSTRIPTPIPISLPTASRPCALPTSTC
jgi:hypothetical protein